MNATEAKESGGETMDTAERTHEISILRLILGNLRIIAFLLFCLALKYCNTP